MILSVQFTHFPIDFHLLTSYSTYLKYRHCKSSNFSFCEKPKDHDYENKIQIGKGKGLST